MGVDYVTSLEGITVAETGALASGGAV